MSSWSQAFGPQQSQGGDGDGDGFSTGLPARRLLLAFLVWLRAQRPGSTAPRLARVLSTGHRLGFLIARGLVRFRRIGSKRLRASYPASVRERASLAVVAPSWDGTLRRMMRTHLR